MRLLALLLGLALAACAGPPPSPPPSEETPSPASRTSAPGELPTGPPPRVEHVVNQVHVAPDGTRTRVQRGYAYGVLGFVRIDDDTLLVEDDDNFEGYTSVRLVRAGRAAGRWNTYGGIVVGRSGAVAFGEATTSEAARKGPVALHLLAGGQHLVQPLAAHPIVHGVVGRRVVFEYRWPVDGETGPFVTDLIGPIRPWDRAVPRRDSYGPTTSTREPDGARLDVVQVGRRSPSYGPAPTGPGSSRPRSSAAATRGRGRRTASGSLHRAEP